MAGSLQDTIAIMCLFESDREYSYYKGWLFDRFFEIGWKIIHDTSQGSLLHFIYKLIF